MSDIFDRAASILERRFLKNAFLPTLLLPLAIVAPALFTGSRLGNFVRAWSEQTLAIETVEIVMYFTISWFLGAILASQWRDIIRLYEGYPLQRLLPRLADRCPSW